jgi:hypothetical protein
VTREAGVNKKSDKSASDLLLELVTSDINLARVFAAIARSAYGLGKTDEAEFARSRLLKFYGEALRSVLQMTDRDRESFSSDLENLRIDINWLSIHREIAGDPDPKTNEAAFKACLLKAVTEKR